MGLKNWTIEKIGGPQELTMNKEKRYKERGDVKMISFKIFLTLWII